jgi:nucleotide-binding universal stress UspA family protein
MWRRPLLSTMYDAILLPTDGSEGSALATENAVVLAERFDAALHAVHVVETGDVTPDDESVDVYEAAHARGRDALDAVAERAEESTVGTVETYLAEGDPYRVVLDYADGHDVDLIVMGTHGRTGLERYLLGSVTEKVVRLSDVPVVTVPMATE